MLGLYYSKLKNEIEKVVELCDSPIEKQLLLKIIEFVLIKSISTLNHIQHGQNFKLYVMDEWVDKNGVIWDLDKPLEEIIVKHFIRIYYSGYSEKGFDRFIDIKPQHKIFYSENKKSINERYYILDFGVFLKESRTEKLIRKFCIECDGYEFHSEKEHIIKDNKRSRKLLDKDSDFTTIRYLGREINQISDEGISELLTILFQEKKDSPFKNFR